MRIWAVFDGDNSYKEVHKVLNYLKGLEMSRKRKRVTDKLPEWQFLERLCSEMPNSTYSGQP